jgi:signal transduction histidine kinase
VIVSLEKKKNNLEFSVEDSGIGIPEDQQERLFSKFFRASNAVRTETEGSGLGLFICKNIIDAHNGEVWFESEQGKGSKFYFSLPIKEKD